MDLHAFLSLFLHKLALNSATIRIATSQTVTDKGNTVTIFK